MMFPKQVIVPSSSYYARPFSNPFKIRGNGWAQTGPFKYYATIILYTQSMFSSSIVQTRKDHQT